MAGWPKNKLATPCFCNFNCPPGGNPYHQYLVRCDDPDFPEFFLGQHLTWRVQTSLLCGYALLNPDETIVAAVHIETTTFGGFDHAYIWVANVTSPTNTDTFLVKHGWNDDDLPINPILTPGCASEFTLLNSDVIPKSFTITPIPDWICDLEQMRAWLAGI